MRSEELVFCILLVILLTSSAVIGQGEDYAAPPDQAESGRRREMVPAMFIFGDSLIDNGNNNNLPFFVKANYYPYGIDFQAGPTGRFSNGYTMVDEIGGVSLSQDAGCLTSKNFSIYFILFLYSLLYIHLHDA